MNMPRVLLLKSTQYQTDLFAEQVPIAGYTDTAGRTHAPTFGVRRKRHDPPASVAPTPAPPRPATLADFPEDAILEQAEAILENRLSAKHEGPDIMSTPAAVRQYLKLKLAGYPHEVFAAMWLDNKHRVIKFSELFRGTIDGASVHPREVVREAIANNAAAVIFAHNHPSGVCEPSQSDINITKRLKDALDLIGVRVLDHLVVGEGTPVSLAERGQV